MWQLTESGFRYTDNPISLFQHLMNLYCVRFQCTAKDPQDGVVGPEIKFYRDLKSRSFPLAEIEDILKQALAKLPKKKKDDKPKKQSLLTRFISVEITPKRPERELGDAGDERDEGSETKGK